MKPVRSIEQRSKIFFHGRRAKLRDQVAAHFHFWCLKRKRKVAEGNCKRVQWRGRPGRERTVSPRGGLTSCGLITSFLGRKVGGPWLNTGRERKLVVKHWRGGRGPSVRPSTHPHPRSAKLIFDPLELKLTKMVFTANLADENNSSNIKEIIFVRRRWAGMIEIIY